MCGLAKKLKLNPILTDPPFFNPSVIENTPRYFPVEVGGIISQASWLIHSFCKKDIEIVSIL